MGVLMLYLKLVGLFALAVAFPRHWFTGCGRNGRFCPDICDRLEHTLEGSIVGQELAIPQISAIVCEHVRKTVSSNSSSICIRCPCSAALIAVTMSHMTFLISGASTHVLYSTPDGVL